MRIDRPAPRFAAAIGLPGRPYMIRFGSHPQPILSLVAGKTTRFTSDRAVSAGKSHRIDFVKFA